MLSLTTGPALLVEVMRAVVAVEVRGAVVDAEPAVITDSASLVDEVLRAVVVVVKEATVVEMGGRRGMSGTSVGVNRGEGGRGLGTACCR